jgi:hypothetical protein
MIKLFYIALKVQKMEDVAFYPVFDTCLKCEPLFPASILMSYLVFPKSVENKSVNKYP